MADSWVAKTSSPVAKSNLVLFVSDGSRYILLTGDITTSCYLYDSWNDSWAATTALPTAISAGINSHDTLLDGKAHIVGATTEVGATLLHYEFDFSGATWTSRTGLTLPDPTNQGAKYSVIAYEGTLRLIVTSLHKVWTSDSWTDATAQPHTLLRNRAAAVDEEGLHLIGGLESNLSAGAVSTHHVYTSAGWTTSTALTGGTKRYNMAAGTVRQTIWTGGGQNDTASSVGNFWRWDFSTDTWATKPVLPVAARGKFASIGNVLYYYYNGGLWAYESTDPLRHFGGWGIPL